ncbi:hypothetical protein LCGC14_1048170 [marine sediment metagenome]|uniref:Uncharacterized protein n=1 Tax=marine sediment metagenome TaxID=412755 RepID=A0A0F9Q7W4_9ZZZZ
MAISINKYGMIEGGGGERIHNQRQARERGAIKCLEKLKERKCFIQKDDKWKLVKPLSHYYSWQRISKFLSGDEEIGWHRFKQDIIPAMIKSKKYWTWKQMIKSAKDIASFELGAQMDSPLSLITPGEKCTFGYAPPHHDATYQQKVKDGYFEEEAKHE